MNAISTDSSCEIVKCFIENFLCCYYTVSDRNERLVLPLLNNYSSSGKSITYELTERILYGKALDRSEFISNHFSTFLPLGLRIKLIEMLENKIPEILLNISSLSTATSSSSFYLSDSLVSPSASAVTGPLSPSSVGSADFPDSIRPSTFQRVYQDYLSKNTYLHQLWLAWKSGNLSVYELFSKINGLFAEKLIDFKTYQFIIETILMEEGYGSRENQSRSFSLEEGEGIEEKEDSELRDTGGSNRSIQLSLRKSFLPSIPFQQSVYLKGISFDSIFSVFPSTTMNPDNELEFLTIDQNLVRFSFENDSYSLSSLSGLFPAASSPLVYWRHCSSSPSSSLPSSSNHVSSDCCTISYSQLVSSSENEVHGVSSKIIAIVNVSDCLRLNRGILEIDSVCAFDVVKSSLSMNNQSFEFAMVVEGRWKGFLSSSDDSSGDSSRMSVDAVTEADPNETNADLYENSPNGSGNDNNNSGQQIIPDYSFPHQYYLLTGISLHSHCSIHSILSLQDSLFPDQTPVGLSYVSSSFGFLYGTNGLLALFEVNMESGYNLPSYWNDEERGSNKNGETNESSARCCYGSSWFPSCDFENSISLSLMTSDTFLLDCQMKDASSFPASSVSHCSDAMITSIDYSPSSHRLVSVDNHSILALWNIHHPSSSSPSSSSLSPSCQKAKKKISFDLVGGSAYPGFNEKHEKVKNVYFTPNGDSLIIACLDKLLIMMINDQLLSSSSSSSSLPFSASSSASPSVSPCWMYERCSLDYFPHHYCLYSVVFHDDVIKIWRISTCDSLLSSTSLSSSSASDNTIEVTSWSHRNIDGFLHRLSSSCSDYSSSSSFHHSSSVFSVHDQSFSSFMSSRDALPLSKEASSEMDQIQDKDGNIMNESCQEGEEYDDDDINENMNFLNFNGEYIPIYPGEIMIDAEDLMMIEVEENEEQQQMEEDDKVILEPIESAYVEDMFLSNYPVYSSCLASSSASDSSPFLSTWLQYSSYLRSRYHHDNNETFLSLLSLFSVLSVCFQPPSLPLLASTLEMNILDLEKLLRKEFSDLLSIQSLSPLPSTSITPASTPASLNSCIVVIKNEFKHFFRWLIGKNYYRLHSEFWIDPSLGHNLLCSLYLKHCSNKSVAVEHTWQSYLSIYGASHLRRASRGLKVLTKQIRKIDETANIRYFLPHQIGYISGLQEIYARRVGLSGKIPKELGELYYLRVLSMGNNHLTGKVPECLGKLPFLQRIVLHQNALGKISHCIRLLCLSIFFPFLIRYFALDFLSLLPLHLVAFRR
jgi:hypothetical protein